nr:nucleoside hydrolase-like domain-containing protein [uncultured Dyadobacter sp.]
MEQSLKIVAAIFCMFCTMSMLSAAAQPAGRHRLIVITDIGNEPDDSQSMVRLMLYTNQMDLEGIIASTSIHQSKHVRPELIRKTIAAYGKVQPTLVKHETGFPTAEKLMSLVKKGLPVYGMEGVGKGKDSEGSDWIVRTLEKADKRPLWISVWGGPNTLAQALWKIRETKPEAEAKRLISKLRVYTISDQDNSGPWIRKNFPDLFYIASPGAYQQATWSAIMRVAPGANNEVIKNDWLLQNIQHGHGPLGAVYPDVAFGMEGDTPSWLALVPNGLSEPEHPNWGGWGGRYEYYKPPFDPKAQWIVPLEEETRPFWTNAEDTYSPWKPAPWGRAWVKDTTVYKNNHVTFWRWREEIQHDFAARMDWCTKSYKQANHPPVAKLTTPDQFTVRSGDTFSLNGSASVDPDGDGLSFLWFQYPEAGSLKQTIPIMPADNLSVIEEVKAPEVESPQTVHFILKVTNKGVPSLARYKRVVVTIVPKQR